MQKEGDYIKVSVIVCTYSKELFSGTIECINSLSAQNYVDKEILLVMDKNDELHQMLLSGVPKSVNILINTNSGLSETRNVHGCNVFFKREVFSIWALGALDVNKDIREKFAVELYKEGKASVGKASEIANLSYEEIKVLLIRNNVQIKRGPASLKELKTKAEELVEKDGYVFKKEIEEELIR